MELARDCVAALLDPGTTPMKKAITLEHYLDLAEAQALRRGADIAVARAAAIRQLYGSTSNDSTDAVLRLGPLLDAAIQYIRLGEALRKVGIASQTDL